MLRHIKDLHGSQLHATDGNVGRVHEFYFDDQRWTIRHVVVATGHWLPRHWVLIPPMALAGVDEARGELQVALTKAQVASSPPVDTEKPVSIQHERELYWHYGFTGSAFPEELQSGAGDPHLRRTREVIGYQVHGVDDRIGHVDDFLVDEGSWSIRYMVVDAQSWWHGKKALVPLRWIVRIRWEGAAVHVDLSRATVRNAPEYDPTRPIERDYETRLSRYYDRAML